MLAPPCYHPPPPVSPVLSEAAVAAPTPRADRQLLSPSLTRGCRTAPSCCLPSPLLRPGPSLSLHMHSLLLCVHALPPVSSSLLFGVSVLLLSLTGPNRASLLAWPGGLPTLHLLYEPALVKFYCAAASALTETISMQKRTHCTLLAQARGALSVRAPDRLGLSRAFVSLKRSRLVPHLFRFTDAGTSSWKSLR